MNFITFLCPKIGRGTFDTECINYYFSIRYKILNNLPIPNFTNYMLKICKVYEILLAIYSQKNDRG